MAPRSKHPDKDDGPVLWKRVTEDVKPLPSELANRAKDVAVEGVAESVAPQPKAVAARKKAPVAANAHKATAPITSSRRDREVASMSIVDQKKIARGARSIDFRVDLHGMNREGAFSTLQHGLEEAGQAGRRRVLIITGKGEGVLNRSAHEWLTTGGLKHLVSEFSPAGPRHGGDGAFYATLRRKR